MSSKAREALEEIVDMGTCYFPDFTLPKNDDELRDVIIDKAIDYTSLRDDFIKAVIIARTALAEPLRNCDVGTAEEQTKRRQRYCKWRQASLSENRTCRGCPVYDVMMMYANEAKEADCDLIWAQMPYEEVNNG